MRWCRFFVVKAGACLAAVLVVQIMGCGSSGSPVPELHPAKGKVVFKGGQPLKGGSIQLLSAADPNLTINGAIREDGTFSLETLVGTTKHPGAPEGEHTVNVNPPQGADQKSIPIRVLTMKQKVAAGPNEFTIEIEKLPR